MDVSDATNTTGNDDQLLKEALEIREFVKKIRTEAGLGPMIKTKRAFADDTEQDTKEDNERIKKQRIENDETEAAEIATKASLQEEKRKGFFSRLNSYSPRFHHRKRPFTALECTKHGWRDTHLVGKQDSRTCILQCDDCHSKMYVISFDPNVDSPKVREVTKIYEEGLLNCHSKDCPWRHGPDKEVIYNFPIKTLEEGVKRFKDNAQLFIRSQECKLKADSKTSSLSDTKDNNNSIPPLQHPLEDSSLSKVYNLATHFQQQAGEDDLTLDIETQHSAYLLSLFGWRLLDPLVPGIECELCCSKRGFYQIKDGEKLNVVTEHKEYCPWVNAETADAYSPKVSFSSRNHKISGYEWMVDMVSIEHNLCMRNKYLSLSSKKAADDLHYDLRQKMRQANDLLKLWNSYSSKKE